MQFDTNAFHAKFAAKYPHDGERFGQLLQSYAWKKIYGSYHLEQATEFLEKAGPQGSISDSKDSFSFLADMLTGGPRGEEITRYRLISQAHVIAAAQTVHSMHDLFNHLCYVGLQLHSLRMIEEHNLFWRDLEQLLAQQNKHPSLLQALVRHRGKNDFKYLHAFVNTTKHNSHILSNGSLDFKNDRVGFHFNAFTYRRKPYPQKWMNDFLQELDAIYVSLTACLVTLETLV